VSLTLAVLASAATHATAARGAEGAEPADVQEPSPLELSLFVDAYAAWQTADEGTLATLSNHRLFSGQGANLRAENGFSLAFLGLDAKYDAGNIGGVASLRFGEGAKIYHYKSDDSDAAFGVDHVYEAYALWRPHERVELDAGLFLSPFGVEVYESWRNPNYTRGAVANYVQPTWHTGLMTKWEIDPQLDLLGFVANGSNLVSEAQERSGLDQTPSVGAQLAYAPNELLSLALGGLVALDAEHNGDSGYDTFADVVATLQLDALTATLNADLIVTENGAPNGRDRYCFGAALLADYRLTDHFGVGARGEYLRDDASYDAGDVWQLVTGTITLDVQLTPVPVSDAGASTLAAPSTGGASRSRAAPLLVLRWENRWEQSNQDVFGKDSRGTEDVADDLYSRVWFESVLGVVFTTLP